MSMTSKGVRNLLFAAIGLMLLAASCNKTVTRDATISDQTVTQNPEFDMSSSGFTPGEMTIRVGTAVIFKNTDSEGHWPASNPHPSHTNLPGFDSLQPVAPGNTYSYTFMKTGTWGFHDHLNPTLHGTVIVVK